jgi:hypothetical protein
MSFSLKPWVLSSQPHTYPQYCHHVTMQNQNHTGYLEVQMKEMSGNSHRPSFANARQQQESASASKAPSNMHIITVSHQDSHTIHGNFSLHEMQCSSMLTNRSIDFILGSTSTTKKTEIYRQAKPWVAGRWIWADREGNDRNQEGRAWSITPATRAWAPLTHRPPERGKKKRAGERKALTEEKAATEFLDVVREELADVDSRLQPSTSRRQASTSRRRFVTSRAARVTSCLLLATSRPFALESPQ